MAALFLLLFSGTIWAANIQIFEPPVIVERNMDDNTIVVEFGLSWDNSWNLNSPPNHDAAWIFMKYRPLGRHGFRHANLHPVENIVMGNDGLGGGSTPGRTLYGESTRENDQPAYVGVFLSRSEISAGSNRFENVRLHWDLEGTGVDENTVLSVRVFAIEMVFIPLGEFASIHTISTGQISTATTPHAPGNIARVAHGAAIAAAITANYDFPLGVRPFYMMKHEISQHAWVDFLNTLTLEQQITLSHINPTAPNNTRFGDLHNGAPFNAAPWGAIAGRLFINVANTAVHTATVGTAAAAVIPDFRHSRMNIRIRQQAVGTTPAIFGVNASLGQYAPAATPTGGWDHEINGGNVPMFGLAWTDVMAYLDWAGLRPLSELEFEKAARGPLQVIQGEHAWGGTAFTVSQAMSARNRPYEVTATSGANVALPSITNANIATAITADIGGRWPLRVGSFAREATSRMEAGGSFWGVLNMSDNVAERFVRFDVATGWIFRGTHGDGNLTGEGLADNRDWPGVVATIDRAATVHLIGDHAAGTIYRGLGSANNTFQTGVSMDWVSGRAFGNNNNRRNPWAGGRGGRSVPVEFTVTTHPSPTARGTTAANVASNAASTVPVIWTVANHTLRVHAVGGRPPFTFQWYWTDEEVAPGEEPMSANSIDGATLPSFLPPHALPHGPRFYFARVTDALGNVVTSNLSGMHTVLGIATNPSTAPVTTSLTQGTNVLTVELAGGAPPFTVTWHTTPAAAAGAQGGAGSPTALVTQVVNSTTINFQPIIPVWIAGAHHAFWASIVDSRGVLFRTLVSGPHIAGVVADQTAANRNVWIGPGFSGTPANAWNVAGDNSGASNVAVQANHIHQVNLTPGLFSFEAWGASGGRGGQGTINFNTTSGTGSNWSAGNSGVGGYTFGFKRITEPTTIYVVPGGTGTSAHANTVASVRLPGGFNGGGAGGSPLSTGFSGVASGTAPAHPIHPRGTRAGAGGGATHISTAPGLLSNTAVRNGIWLAAGGGGGGGCWGNTTMTSMWGGGAGGGTEGQSWTGINPTGGTQTGGGAAGQWAPAGTSGNATVVAQRLENATPGTAGQGGQGMHSSRNMNSNIQGFSGGGGGGWFGGGGGGDGDGRTLGTGGAGGSGHIAPALTHAAGGITLGSPATGAFRLTGAASSAIPARVVSTDGQTTAGANVPIHPAGAQNIHTVRPGAVRILRLQ